VGNSRESNERAKKFLEKRNKIDHDYGNKNARKVENYHPTEKNVEKKEIDADFQRTVIIKASYLARCHPFECEIIRIRMMAGNEAINILMKLCTTYGVKFSKLLEIEENAKLKIKDFLKQRSTGSIISDFNENSQSSDLLNRIANS